MKLRQEIVTAMIYPCILASFSLLSSCFADGFCLPSIEGIFADGNLIGFTQAVFVTEPLFARLLVGLYAILIALIVYLVYKASQKQGALEGAQFFESPLMRTLMIQTAVARFCRTMGTLQQGACRSSIPCGLPAKSCTMWCLEEEIKKAEAKIIEGSSLSAELDASKWFPMMVSRMLAVGEESGTHNFMLNKIADMYEEEIEKTLARLMALAQPVILVVMGSIIGCVLLAILLPLTDISSFTSQ